MIVAGSEFFFSLLRLCFTEFFVQEDHGLASFRIFFLSLIKRTTLIINEYGSYSCQINKACPTRAFELD